MRIHGHAGSGTELLRNFRRADLRLRDGWAEHLARCRIALHEGRIGVDIALDDRDVQRIQQPTAPQAGGCGCVDIAKRLQIAARGRFHLPTVARVGATSRRDRSLEVGVVFRPQDGSAAIAALRCGNVDGSSLVHHHLRGIADLAILALPASADIHLAATGLPGGGGLAGRRQVDIPTLNGDFAALSGRAIGQQAPRLAHHAAVATVQHDLAAAAFQSCRLDGAAIVHHRVQQHIPTTRRQVDLTVGCRDQTGIFHQGVHDATADRHRHQPGVVQLQGDLVRCRQHGLARWRGDSAAVLHLSAGQHDVAARRCHQAALVDDLGVSATAAKVVAARHEIGVAQALGGGQQARHVHLCILAEHNPVRVQNDHLAIGLQASQYLRTTGPRHPVQRHRVAVGLDETHGILRTDIETLPLRDQLVRLLPDGHLVAGRADGALARDDLAADRQVRVGQRQSRQCGECQRGQHRTHRPHTRAGDAGARSRAACAFLLASPGGQLAHGNQLIAAPVKFQSIDLVHCSCSLEIRTRAKGVRHAPGVKPRFRGRMDGLG
ncbi:Uncharacterised protein [Achromobacter xylosoxidans]|nr:Uncharacterised protein [Achromobacter xylosoxidans]